MVSAFLQQAVETAQDMAHNIIERLVVEVAQRAAVPEKTGGGGKLVVAAPELKDRRKPVKNRQNTGNVANGKRLAAQSFAGLPQSGEVRFKAPDAGAVQHHVVGTALAAADH